MEIRPDERGGLLKGSLESVGGLYAQTGLAEKGLLTSESYGLQVQQDMLALQQKIDQQGRFNQTRNVARWAAAGAMATGASLGMLHVTQPSVEERVGPLRVELSTNSSGGVEVLGEKLDGPLGFVGGEVSLQAPHAQDIPYTIDEVSEIARELRTNPEKSLEDILEERYSKDLFWAGVELAVKSGLLVALTSAAVFSAANEALRPGSRQKHRVRSAGVGFLGAGAVFAGSIGLSVHTFDEKAAGREMDQAITPYIEDYFTDKTTREVINYRKVSREVSRNLIRLDRYGQELSLSRSIDKNLVWVVVSSDEHDAAPYQQIEAIDRIFGASANVSLGDFTNRGTEAENDLLGGPELFGTDFMGIDEIRTCELWNQTDPVVCSQEGERIPHYYVLGNHDTPQTGARLQSLGLIDIDQEIFSLPGIAGRFAGVADGCFHVDANCHTNAGDSQANRAAGDRLQTKLSLRDVRPQAIFASHTDTAKALDGWAPVVITGELHRDDLVELEQGTKVYVVGTAGQALGREAPKASVSVFGFDPATGELKDCRVVNWQNLTASVTPTVEICHPTEGRL